MLLVLGAAVLYGQVADEPVVRRALAGMGAVAGGMILATAFKLVLAWRAHPAWLAWGVLAFIGVALLHLKVLLVLAVLVPPAIAAAWWWLRAASRRGDPR
jgi:chromate transporter